jgi:hypothetical protein
LIEKKKREMIAERYRQFETAYSNFKGRHSAHRSMNSGASFSFNKTTNNDTDTHELRLDEKEIENLYQILKEYKLL